LALQIIAPPQGEISIAAVRGLFYQLRERGMQFGKITYDSWGSDESIQTLRSEGFTAEVLSVDRTAEPYTVAKAAIYDERVECYHTPILEKELSNLIFDARRDKVDHPPHGSKDVADCFAAVVFHCETGFTGGATSQWATVTTLTTAPRTSSEDDQEDLWDKIWRGIPLSPEQIQRVR
jgi:phage terminase large subunit-like protein